MEASTVAQRMGLTADYGLWLESLQAAGPPPAGVGLPRGKEAAALLDRLEVGEPDLSAIVGALPSAESHPELWWLLERAYHRELGDIGRWHAATGPWPSLPSELGVQARCFWVFVFMAAVPAIRRWHQERGIADAVSWMTLADLGRHVGLYRRRNGYTGFDGQFWLSLHFRGALYALGRLQFLPYRLRTGPGGPLFWYDDDAVEKLGAGFRPGDTALSVHIPEAGPLTPAACDQSFQAAKVFFADHFPDLSYRIVTCTSWLLDDELARYLPSTSNMVRFQSRFELVPGVRDADDEVFRFVFGRVPDSLDEITPRTALERAILRHVGAGEHWHLRTGWLTL